MKRIHFAVLALGLALLAPPARAAATFEYLFDGGYPLRVSNDGSIVVGNDASGGFVPFRWTQAGGFVSLGRPQYVGGGGMPGMSADGSKVASSIGSLDSSYTTQGLWTQGSGWTELMPPIPPDGGISDGSYGNVYSMSGDGNTVVGLYWRHGFGSAHASKWTQATGVVDLGGQVTNHSSRANDVNFDGSVIVGWLETNEGPWRPAAWANGTCTLLTTYDASVNTGSGEARVVSRDGNVIAGMAIDPATQQTSVAMWKRTAGVFGPTQYVGFIDGSEPRYGKTIPYGVSDDGKIIVGYATYAGDPFDVTGFVWTQQTGVVDAITWLGNNGVFVDPNFQIKQFSAITPDGTQIFGFGQMLTAPYTRKAFKVTLPGPLAVNPPAAGRLALAAPSPNPTSAGSRLDFTLARATNADLSIFDTAGRHVVTLVKGDLPAGPHSQTWGGRDASGQTVTAGVYFARLSTPEGTRSQRIVRLD